MSLIEDILTNEDFTAILEEKYQSKEVELLKAKCLPLSENIEGFMGDHYILTLNFIFNNNEQQDTFFIKTKPRKNESQREVTDQLNLYYKEIYMYDFIFKQFEKYGFKVNFAPKCYYCKNNETMVMEDLKSKGYKIVDRKSFLDLNQCKAALKSLAYYHANSIAYEEIKTKELGKIYYLNEENPEAFKETYYVRGDRNSLGDKYDQSTTNCLAALANLLPKSENWKTKFTTKIKNLNLPEIVATKLNSRKTCGHGDLWGNNMLFKEINGQIECILIDYQASRHHHPSFDALLVLYSSTSRAFRQKHKTELLLYHYHQMDFILESYGFNMKDILTEEDYLKSAKVFESVALVQGAGSRTITMLPTEITSKVVTSGGNDFGELLFSDLRADLAVAAFEKDEEFRLIMTDDIYDIDEILK